LIRELQQAIEDEKQNDLDNVMRWALGAKNLNKEKIEELQRVIEDKEAEFFVERGKWKSTRRMIRSQKEWPET
jgi:hypothetical protein